MVPEPDGFCRICGGRVHSYTDGTGPLEHWGSPCEQTWTVYECESCGEIAERDVLNTEPEEVEPE